MKYKQRGKERKLARGIQYSLLKLITQLEPESGTVSSHTPEHKLWQQKMESGGKIQECNVYICLLCALLELCTSA